MARQPAALDEEDIGHMFDCATVANHIKRQDISSDWQFLPVRRWYLVNRFLLNVCGLVLIEGFFVFSGIGIALQHVSGTVLILVILLGIMVLIVHASFLSLRVQFFDCIYWRDEYVVFVADGIFLSTRILPKHVRCLPFAQIQSIELIQITRIAIAARGGSVKAKIPALVVTYSVPKRKVATITLDNRFGNSKVVLQHCITSLLNYKASQE